MWAVVPCKRLDLAKRRLAPVLSAAERRGLVRAMVSDVLGVLAATPGLSGVLVVGDPVLAALAGSHGARFLPEFSDGGVSAALDGAADFLSRRGAAGIMAVPGDVPLLAPQDVARVPAMMDHAPAVAVAPDRRHRGTNLLAMTPAGAIPFLFGRASFPRHLAAAREAGIEPVVMASAGLGLDIDTPEDLRAFARNRSPTRTYRYLVESGIHGRLIGRPAGLLKAGAG